MYGHDSTELNSLFVDTDRRILNMLHAGLTLGAPTLFHSLNIKLKVIILWQIQGAARYQTWNIQTMGNSANQLTEDSNTSLSHMKQHIHAAH